MLKGFIAGIAVANAFVNNLATTFDRWIREQPTFPLQLALPHRF